MNTEILTASLLAAIGAALVMFVTGSGVYASRHGKFVVWEKLIGDLRLLGHEHILDLGCGRGAVLLQAARYLTTGKAVGVDLWRASGQSGNDQAATERNAVAEWVEDRVELQTADMTELPFEDGRFNVVLSSLAVHDIGNRAGRERAIDEAVRVLKPGGRLLIADMLGTRDYERRLAELGMAAVRRRSLGWRMWWSGPWLRTCVVSATKPSGVLGAAGPAVAGDQLDLEPAGAGEIRGIVIRSARMGVLLSEHRRPAVLGRQPGQGVDTGTVAGVEREMVQPGAHAVMSGSGHGGRLLNDDVGRTQLPAASLRPVLVPGVAELSEQPAPLRRCPGQVGHPQLDVVQGATARRLVHALAAGLMSAATVPAITHWRGVNPRVVGIRPACHVNTLADGPSR